MSATIYREFTLSAPAVWTAVTAFVKANAAAMVSKGKALRIIVTEDDADRLDEQIAYYFGVVIKTISEQAWVDGRQFSKDAWHEQLARDFLPPIEIQLPDGEIVIRRQSIARGKIGVKAMAKFTQDVTVFAASELGVVFE